MHIIISIFSKSPLRANVAGNTGVSILELERKYTPSRKDRAQHAPEATAHGAGAGPVLRVRGALSSDRAGLLLLGFSSPRLGFRFLAADAM